MDRRFEYRSTHTPAGWVRTIWDNAAKKHFLDVTDWETLDAIRYAEDLNRKDRSTTELVDWVYER